MPRFSLGRSKPDTSDDRAASEREVLKAVRVTGHERLRKGRVVQMAFRLKVEERRKIEDVADRLGLSFTDTLVYAIDMVEKVLDDDEKENK